MVKVIPEPLPPPEPLAAAVILPCASTVIFEFVYVPGVTVVSFNLTVNVLTPLGAVTVVDKPGPPANTASSPEFIVCEVTGLVGSAFKIQPAVAGKVAKSPIPFIYWPALPTTLISTDGFTAGSLPIAISKASPS